MFESWSGETRGAWYVSLSLMAKLLGRVSQGHEMYSLDLQVLGSKPGQIEVKMRSRPASI